MNPVRDCYISSRESRNNIMKQEQKISNGMKKITLPPHQTRGSFIKQHRRHLSLLWCGGLLITILLLAGLVLIGASCGKGDKNGDENGGKETIATPSEVVNLYMKSTLGTLPDSNIDYDLAKQQMTSEFREQFTNPSFIPLSYCIQDGPEKVRIDSENISNDTARVRVSGFYTEWQDMWEFGLVIQESEWKIKDIICAPFSTTYTNTKYGFSFEYPEKWYLEDNPEFGNVFLSSKEEEAPMGGVSLGVRIEIFIIENTENLGLEEWISWIHSEGGTELTGESAVVDRKEITVGGVKAMQEEYVTPSITVYLAKDNYIIQINYTGRDPDYYTEMRSFNNLLDSFEFN